MTEGTRASTMLQAVIIFVDIRGFTAWSSHIHGDLLTEFLTNCYTAVYETFDSVFTKTLGDGIMLIQEVEVPRSAEAVSGLLSQLLHRISVVETAFREICTTFHMCYGLPTPLHLGWGVTRGVVTAFDQPELGIQDYVGLNINKAARLCGLARPHGIMIAADNFPALPQLEEQAWGAALTAEQRTFLPQDHQVSGIHEPIPVWALLTMESSPQGPVPLAEGTDSEY